MRKLGNRGEDLAVDFLESRGFELIERNFSSRFGEIDIIARDGKYIIFVEVKLRRPNAMVTGFEAVGASKQKKIIKTAAIYLQGQESGLTPRFDVILVEIFGEGDDEAAVTHIRNAFEVENFHEVF